MTPVWDVAPHPQASEREGPGSFREHDIAPFPGGMQPPPWSEVSALTRDWVSDVRKLRKVGDPTLIERLADLHARFEQIHPYLDGNGRTGRLTLNLVLVRLDYPPAIIYKGDRARYLAKDAIGELLTKNGGTGYVGSQLMMYPGDTQAFISLNSTGNPMSESLARTLRTAWQNALM